MNELAKDALRPPRREDAAREGRGGMLALPPRRLAFSALGLFTAAFAFLNSFSQGASLQLEAQISDGQVSAGQSFVYQVTATSGGGQIDLKGLEMPDFDGLTVSGETRQSTSLTQQLGGAVEMKVSVGRTLIAYKEGTYTIPPARLRYGGQFAVSNPVTVVVAKPTQEKLPSSFRDEPILPAKTEYLSLNKQLEGRLFLRPTLSKTDPYEGEPVLATYTALSDFDPRTLRLEESLVPQIAGLQGNDFEIYTVVNVAPSPGAPPSQPQARQIQVEGKTYQAVVVYQAYCVPKKPGTLSLGPYFMGARIPVDRQPGSRRGLLSLFDDSYAEAVLPTMPLELHVKPLPVEGRPPDFDNAIGEFAIQAELDRQSMNEDDLATLKVAIRGRGHIGAIGQPKLPALEDFEVFDSAKRQDQIVGAEDGLRGEKVFEIVLRAKRPGALTIPPISFTAFNPWKSAYERVSTDPISVQVAASEAKPLVIEHATGQPGSGAAGPAVRKLAEGLAYIQTVGFSGQGPGLPLSQDPWFLALQAAPILLVSGTFALRRRRDRLERDTGLARRRGAGAAAAKRLRKAAKLARGAEADAFYAELSAALRGFFADKLNRPASGLVIEEIAEELTRRAVEDETVQAVSALLERCDQARFAPGAGEPQARRQALDGAARLIGALAKRI